MSNSNTGESKMQNDISKEAPLVLDGNTVIKGILRVKPVTGSVVGVTNNGELVIKELKAE